MPAGVPQPAGERVAQRRGLKPRRAQFSQRLPAEADPGFGRSHRRARREPRNGEFKHQVDLGMGLAVLQEGVFAAAEKTAGR